MIFVNFKTYDQGSGQNAVALARVCYEAGLETQVKVIPVVQALDAERIVDSVRSDVWIQHTRTHHGRIYPQHDQVRDHLNWKCRTSHDMFHSSATQAKTQTSPVPLRLSLLHSRHFGPRLYLDQLSLLRPQLLLGAI